MNEKSPREIWQLALGELQIQVSKPNFDTWLKDTKGVKYEEDTFVIGAPSTFVAEWLKSRLHSLIKNTLAKLLGKVVDIQFSIFSPDQMAEPPILAARPDGGITIKSVRKNRLNMLNPAFTFNNFVIGESNHLAYSTAVEVAQNPGQIHNPLFIYSDTGLGKTHLLHAIGNTAKSSLNNIICTNAEQLTSEFVNALKNNKTEEFTEKFTNTDMLLLDDFQLLSGRKQTQQCFFHLFDELHNNECQIVITCDCPPKAISSLGEKLRSRLEWGLVTVINPPNFDTRVAILNEKAKISNAKLPVEVLHYLASQLTHNVRELEGGLHRVIAYARLHNSEINLDLAIKAMEPIVDGEKKTPFTSSPRAIIEAVAAHYRLTPDTLTGKRRDRKINLARQVAMYLIRDRLNCSLSEIGKLFSNRDHTTILYSYQKIASEKDIDHQLNSSIEAISREISNK